MQKPCYVRVVYRDTHVQFGGTDGHGESTVQLSWNYLEVPFLVTHAGGVSDSPEVGEVTEDNLDCLASWGGAQGMYN